MQSADSIEIDHQSVRRLLPRRMSLGNKFIWEREEVQVKTEKTGFVETSKFRVGCFLSCRLFYDYDEVLFIMQPEQDGRRNIQFAATAYAYLKKVRSWSNPRGERSLRDHVN